jgi:hypothetical protein
MVTVGGFGSPTRTPRVRHLLRGGSTKLYESTMKDGAVHLARCLRAGTTKLPSI